MRIAQVAPPFESVPPTRYGGTERVVSLLTEELVRRGHDVTLFASGDSDTARRADPDRRHGALAPRPSVRDPLVYWTITLGEVVSPARRRVRHHPLPPRLPALPLRRAGRTPDRDHAARPARPAGPAAALRATSRRAARLDLRQPARAAARGALGRHGLQRRRRRPARRSTRAGGEYLAFLGRISPEKGLDRAIRDRPAGRHAAEDRRQLPLGPTIRIGRLGVLRGEHRAAARRAAESSSSARSATPRSREFLGNALALLFPIDWPEPFGLVMAEALACGTPVIARRRGSVPEVVDGRRDRADRRDRRRAGRALRARRGTRPARLSGARRSGASRRGRWPTATRRSIVTCYRTESAHAPVVAPARPSDRPCEHCARSRLANLRLAPRSWSGGRRSPPTGAMARRRHCGQWEIALRDIRADIRRGNPELRVHRSHLVIGRPTTGCTEDGQ